MAARRLERDDDGCAAFLRCLYQARSIIHHLENLTDSTAHLISGNLDDIKSYVDSTFDKLLRLFRGLLVILIRMESRPQMSKIRIASFRDDLDSEWRHASIIHHIILDRIQHLRLLQDAPSPTAHEPDEGSHSPWSPSPILPTY